MITNRNHWLVQLNCFVQSAGRQDPPSTNSTSVTVAVAAGCVTDIDAVVAAVGVAAATAVAVTAVATVVAATVAVVATVTVSTDVVSTVVATAAPDATAATVVTAALAAAVMFAVVGTPACFVQSSLTK